MGGVQKNWKDRWFVVTDNGIVYFKNRQVCFRGTCLFTFEGL